MWCCSNKIVAVAAFGNQTDHFALLKFKESISTDPFTTLESWNSSIHFISPYCQSHLSTIATTLS
jgi:hypothetical protein